MPSLRELDEQIVTRDPLDGGPFNAEDMKLFMEGFYQGFYIPTPTKELIRSLRDDLTPENQIRTMAQLTGQRCRVMRTKGVL